MYTKKVKQRGPVVNTRNDRNGRYDRASQIVEARAKE